jgi:hypothetical protein
MYRWEPDPQRGKEMKKIVAAASLALLISFPAWASSGSSCYTPKEIEAEQAIRIHSELMVIGLTCLRMPQGQAMYTKYQSFTQKNQRLLAEYENDLISYYRRVGFEQPEKKLHTLRTTIANEISTHAISISVSNFCQTFGPRVDKALQMDQQKIRQWAQQNRASSPSSHPVCTSTARL